MGSSSRSGLRLLSCLIAVTALVLVVASSAFGAETRLYTGISFGPDGAAGSESFNFLQSVTVDQASGNVYAFDAGAGKIYKFDAAGGPVDFSSTGTNAISEVGGAGGGEEQLAIAPPGSPGGTAGDIYAANNFIVKVYSPSGTKLGEFGEGETCGVATDPAGHVFVGSYSSTITEYVPSGNPVTNADKTATGTANVGLCNVAADGLGHVYAANFAGSRLAKLAGIGDASPTITEPGGASLAIDPGSNDLFLNRGNLVSQIDSNGNPIGNFGSGRLSSSYGVAVKAGAEEIYVGNGANQKVDVFGAPVVVPDVTAEAATSVTGKKATLHGVVNSAGQPVTNCEFEYGNGEGPNTKVPCEGSVPNDGNDHQVSAALTELTPGRVYTARLLAANANGQNSSSAVEFATFAGVATEPATEITGTGAKLNGVVAPENEAVSECFFEYGPVAFGNPDDYSLTAPCVGEIPADEGAHAVSAVIGGLHRGTQYHFRLFVKQPGGELRGETRQFEPVGAQPTNEKVSTVGTDHAILEAEINPRGSATSYFFEWGTSPSYGNTTPEENLGSVEEFLPVSQKITGLTSGTTYHWRVVIIDSFGEGQSVDHTFMTQLAPGAPETDCANQTFREFAGAPLPDCRAYEQVSPVDKGSVGIEGLRDFFNASPDGFSVSFYSQAYTGMPAGGGAHQNFSTLLASRDGDTWSTQRLSQPEELGEKSEFLGLSVDHRYAFVEGFDNTGQGSGLYAIDTSDQSIEAIVPPALNPEGGDGGFARYAIDGTSTDGSLVFFETRAQILPDATEGVGNLYMWNRNSGELSIVGILPGSPEEASTTGSFGGAYLWFQGSEPQQGGALWGNYVEAVHAISSDGDQIYFTAGETGQIYLRKGLRGGSPTTIRVSAPTEGVVDPNGQKLSAFQEATPDGSRAFFTSAQKLTSDATTGTSDEGKDLYRWDATDGTLVDIAPDADDPNGAEVLGLLGISSDGSAGYFAAKGKLANGAKAGDNNLYRFAEGAGGNFEIKFIARLSEDTNYGDAFNWSPRSREHVAPAGDAARTSRVTPSGDALLFSSSRPLTGYNSDRHTGFGSVAELFRYDANAEQLICVSCSPTGETAKGPAELSTEFLNAFLTPNVSPIPHLTRVMTPDGDRIFFQSPDALVAGDLNSQKKKCTYYSENYGGSNADCLDVYEWEAAGSKACPTAIANGGCLFLLSTGESNQPSNLVDVSTDGSSAFIATASQLVPSDRDSLYDVYDARVNGGLASQHTGPLTACQSGQACHGASSTPPTAESPGTGTFEGPGNVKQAGGYQKKICKKGKKRSCKKAKKGHHKAKAKPAHKGSKKNGGSK